MSNFNSIKKSFTLSVVEGFSLIEVLIFVTILSIFLIAAATIITVLMHQNILRLNMLKATHYNEQLLEWIRSEKETDWNAFTGRAGNFTYCFKDDIWSSWPFTGVCSSYELNGMYKRYAVFSTTIVGGVATQVNVTVFTEWQEAGNNYSTKLHTLFTLWEE